LRSDLDRQIVARIVASTPALGGITGWTCRFGRELNASDDRRHFTERGLPVLEGKSIEPFRVNLDLSSARITRSVAARILKTRPFDRPRLGYREVASATNRLTLFAAMIPADAVTTHTIFCLKEPLDAEAQLFLCGIFNSFVANYLVRLRGSTHVTASMMAQLPVPKPPRTSIDFQRVTALSRTLSASPDDTDAYAAVQAHAARLYGLQVHDFEHVAATFPLVAGALRDASVRAFRSLMDGI
jgi:hypothetical protein